MMENLSSQPLQLPTVTSTTSLKLNPTPKPWYTHLTLDLALHILSRSIFHPFIVLTFYLSLAAVHKHTTPLALYTLYYALGLLIVDVLIYADRRISGGGARKVNWGREVVVITGGATGLGRCLVEVLARRGVGVAVMDVRGPDGEVGEWLVGNGGCVAWYECDVADRGKVAEVAERIRED